MQEGNNKYFKKKFDQTKDFQLNIFTLNFSDKEKEIQFRKNYFEKSIYIFRVSFVIVTLLYAGFGFFDPISSPQNADLFHFIRFAVVVPLLLVTFLISFTKLFKEIWQALLMLCLNIGGIGIVIMLLQDQDNMLYYGGLFLVFMSGFFFIKLRFFNATFSGMFILLAYNIGALFLPTEQINSNYILISNAFYISAIIIGMFALYHLEYLERKNFHQNLLLESQKDKIEEYNKNLEQIVKERTQMLNNRNVELTNEIENRKKIEKELIIAKVKAEEISRLKSNFLANMSHEFRTPMNGILGMASILKESIEEDKEKEKLVDGIVKSGIRLMSTLDAVLTLADLESFVESKKKYPVNVSEVINEIIPKYIKTAEAKGLVFISAIENDSLEVYTLKRNLLHIVEHLLDNAIKFTDKGKVELNVERQKIDEKHFVRITVIDTGIGIAREHQDVIFDDFRQASEGFSRIYEGSGLGLSIVKKSVDLLNGTITVQSEKEKGSAFTVLLPAEVLEKQETEIVKQVINKKITESNQTNLKGLLVEDNFINKQTIELYLRDICTLDHAKNGQIAIEKAKSNKYDFVLMDINLSAGINGVETTKEIRKIEGYENTPVVAVTGYTMESDKEKFLSEGLTHFIPKPFFKEDIVGLISQIFSR